MGELIKTTCLGSRTAGSVAPSRNEGRGSALQEGVEGTSNEASGAEEDSPNDMIWTTIVQSVQPRGPDYSNSLVKEVSINSTNNSEDGLTATLRFHASILHMRGDALTRQPFVSEANGDVFLFNGEIFRGLKMSLHENDGSLLFSLIQSVGLLRALKAVEGPYALIYYQAATHRLYFTRDGLGRRSLLLHTPTVESPAFYLSSNGQDVDFVLNDWKEVDAGSLWCLELGELTRESLVFPHEPKLVAYPRVPKPLGLAPDSLIFPFPRLNATLPPPARPTPSPLTLTLSTLHSHLLSSLTPRVLTAPFTPLPSPTRTKAPARVAVLFSGGIDCTTIALLLEGVVPRGEEIDLINVAFENPRVVRAKVELEEVRRRREEKARKREERGLGKGKAREREGGEDEGESLVAAPTTGDDSTKVEEEDGSIYDVPDRITGRASLAELRKLCPNRKWNFVEVDVPFQEMLEAKPKVIELMRPQRTVMDLSISLAFFFAARGRGHVTSTTTPPYTLSYQSHARVLLSGLGADELLGGYARHRRAFDRGAGQDWAGLINEMQMDLDRISVRNLGRDDRIVSWHAKEVRYPFLDAEVVEFCANLPIWEKCDMRLEEGLGDKLLLRKLAASLGLEGASTLLKRAIHFGARTAKMELGTGGAKGEELL